MRFNSIVTILALLFFTCQSTNALPMHSKDTTPEPECHQFRIRDGKAITVTSGFEVRRAILLQPLPSSFVIVKSFIKTSPTWKTEYEHDYEKWKRIGRLIGSTEDRGAAMHQDFASIVVNNRIQVLVKVAIRDALEKEKKKYHFIDEQWIFLHMYAEENPQEFDWVRGPNGMDANPIFPLDKMLPPHYTPNLALVRSYVMSHKALFHSYIMSNYNQHNIGSQDQASFYGAPTYVTSNYNQHNIGFQDQASFHGAPAHVTPNQQEEHFWNGIDFTYAC